MGLVAALGLLGLIGIPALIIIYILKPKYQERVISSTYIWKLSLKYRKRKIPLQWLKSFLLMVQIFIVLLITFLICQPYIKGDTALAKGAREHEKILILDSSASMLATNGGQTRYERALDALKNEAKSATTTNPVTVIVASEVPFYVAKQDYDYNAIERYLDSTVACSYGEPDYATAIQLATEILKLNPENAKISLFTDHTFKKNGYIDVVNVAEDEWNVAVLDAYSNFAEDESEESGSSSRGAELGFCVNLGSYNKAAKVTVSLEIKHNTFEFDAVLGETTAIEKVTTITKVVDLPQATGKEEHPQQVTFSAAEIKEKTDDLRRIASFNSAKVTILGENGGRINDAFAVDNEFSIYGGKGAYVENFNVQLVSEQPLFIRAALQSLKTCDISVVEDWTLDAPKEEGFDLYIYDSYYAKTANFPSDGAVWIIDPSVGANYTDLGFTTSAAPSRAGAAARFSALANEDNTDHPIMENVVNSDIFYGKNGDEKLFELTQFTELTYNKEFNTLATVNGKSVISEMTRENNTKLILWAFDLNYTDFPLTFNYISMVANIANYTLKQPLETNLYYPGEEVVVNLKPNATSIEVLREGSEDIDSYEDHPSYFTVKEPGVYTVVQYFEDPLSTKVIEPIESKLFVRISEVESNFALVGGALAGDEFHIPDALVSTESTGDDVDLSIYFAWALLAFLLIEWGLQYREQY